MHLILKPFSRSVGDFGVDVSEWIEVDEWMGDEWVRRIGIEMTAMRGRCITVPKQYNSIMKLTRPLSIPKKVVAD